ncbi:hypothetical protein DR999_PMT18592 [Platysternon megacephalum]|uniref:Uncharacterized protein n=1 Tax=Platysternon megacephalum TaxID=55544 RepID=A0A4D9DSD3_9SAUR|nr:hypothetical protein DR999_PMT18592 [Platysternon megacephalum]
MCIESSQVQQQQRCAPGPVCTGPLQITPACRPHHKRDSLNILNYKNSSTSVHRGPKLGRAMRIPSYCAHREHREAWDRIVPHTLCLGMSGTSLPFTLPTPPDQVGAGVL